MTKQTPLALGKLTLAAALAAFVGTLDSFPASADEGLHKGWEKHGMPPGQAKKHHREREEWERERPVVVVPQTPIVVPQQPTVVMKPSSNTTVVVPLNLK